MTDIQPGDVVVCVDVRKSAPHPLVRFVGRPGYRLGAMYRVTDVWKGASGRWFLRFSDYPHHSDSSGVAAWRFRKIRPADPEFVSLIQRVKGPA